jgi:peptide subunit release factor 1 (eRF1)
VQKHLKQELSTADNIKSKQVRKAVIKALGNIINNLPKGDSGRHGLVILSGEIKSYF